MPVYNAERFLAEAIDSILNQTYKDFEFIIINDGSTDRSEEIIKSYHDDRIVYVKNGKNLKLIKTLNKGIDLARGKFIARMDADDVSLPDRFERQMKVFEEHPEIDFINGRAYNINEAGESIGQEWYGPVQPDTIRYINVFCCIICHPSVMIKASLLKAYKYSDNKMALHTEDYDLWARLLIDKHSCYSMKIPVLKYRIVSNSIVHKYTNDIIEHLYVSVPMYVGKYGGFISPKDIETLNGINNTFSGLKSLHKMFNDFTFNVLQNEDNKIIHEFTKWRLRRELRVIKAMLLQRDYKEFYTTIFKIVIPNIISYARALI